MRRILEDGATIVLPEIVDYETRRALLRIGSGRSISSLDRLTTALRFEPLTTTSMRLAARFWADIRSPFSPQDQTIALTST
ncbi:MAG TPA: hypothetical protein VMM78_16240 [Thermomicrobiales bacterium]|nr:hypothetical protein [Thermomicrobiales bacterium]